MEIVALDKGKEAVCRRILDALPQWFGIETAREGYVSAARDFPMFACLHDGEAIGFATVKTHNDFTAEIHSMGVLPEWHRRRIGTRLVDQVVRHANDRRLQFLTVKTLGPSNPDACYRATRRFYSSVGFVPLEELPDLWGPDNPCLLMMKCLGDQTS